MIRFKALLLTAVIAFNMNACADSSPKKELKIEKSNVVSVTATVEAIDHKSRIVAIKRPDGGKVTMKVGEEVVNLPKVKVGDTVAMEYIESLAVRMGKPGEVVGESAILTGKAQPGNMPSGASVSETTVSATIEKIDKKNQTATIKTITGDVHTVKAQDPSNLEKVKIGDTIIITYTEAVALSVQKTVKP
jgi:hypothetical protein